MLFSSFYTVVLVSQAIHPESRRSTCTLTTDSSVANVRKASKRLNTLLVTIQNMSRPSCEHVSKSSFIARGP